MHNNKADGAFDHLQKAFMAQTSVKRVLKEIKLKKNPGNIKWVENGDESSEQTDKEDHDKTTEALLPPPLSNKEQEPPLVPKTPEVETKKHEHGHEHEHGSVSIKKNYIDTTASLFYSNGASLIHLCLLLTVFFYKRPNSEQGTIYDRQFENSLAEQGIKMDPKYAGICGT